MRTFTIKYVNRGRTATATVQGNEVTTLNDLFCIRHDGMPIATFPKEDVLHVTSHADEDDWPAPVMEDLGMPVGSRFSSHIERGEAHWMRLRGALDSTSLPETALRAARRVPVGEQVRRRHAGGVAAAADSIPSTTRSW